MWKPYGASFLKHHRPTLYRYTFSGDPAAAAALRHKGKHMMKILQEKADFQGHNVRSMVKRFGTATIRVRKVFDLWHMHIDVVPAEDKYCFAHGFLFDMNDEDNLYLPYSAYSEFQPALNHRDEPLVAGFHGNHTAAGNLVTWDGDGYLRYFDNGNSESIYLNGCLLTKVPEGQIVFGAAIGFGKIMFIGTGPRFWYRPFLPLAYYGELDRGLYDAATNPNGWKDYGADWDFFNTNPSLHDPRGMFIINRDASEWGRTSKTMTLTYNSSDDTFSAQQAVELPLLDTFTTGDITTTQERTVNTGYLCPTQGVDAVITISNPTVYPGSNPFGRIIPWTYDSSTCDWGEAISGISYRGGATAYDVEFYQIEQREFDGEVKNYVALDYPTAAGEALKTAYITKHKDDYEISWELRSHEHGTTNGDYWAEEDFSQFYPYNVCTDWSWDYGSSLQRTYTERQRLNLFYGDQEEIIRFELYIEDRLETKALAGSGAGCERLAGPRTFNEFELQNIHAERLEDLSLVDPTVVYDTVVSEYYYCRLLAMDLRTETAIFIRVDTSRGATQHDISVYCMVMGTKNIVAEASIPTSPFFLSAPNTLGTSLWAKPGNYAIGSNNLIIHDAQIVTDRDETILYADVTLANLRYTKAFSVTHSAGDTVQTILIDPDRAFTTIKGM